jgi:carboxyl-terminal processing protease
MLDRSAGIGYLRLAQFSRNSHSEICKAMDHLKRQGMKSIIIDLRGNGGGYLDQVVDILNEFLERNKLIVYVEDRYGRRMNEFSNGRGRYADTKMAVLVDEISASSSEILAGAIQDNDRGLIIGRRTFGKGLVQAELPFRDGSAMRLTVARYYIPSGRSIQRPYTSGDDVSYHMDLINRYNHHELFSEDSVHLDKSKEYYTSAGRVVYGGGGVMPDIFVPVDTTQISDFYNKVWDANILYRYTLDYTDRNRDKFDNVASLADLDAVFNDTDIIKDFVAYAKRQGVTATAADVEASRKVLLAQIRAYIGRNTLSDESGYYYNIYPIDDVMLRAVEELRAGGLKLK